MRCSLAGGLSGVLGEASDNLCVSTMGLEACWGEGTWSGKLTAL